MRGLFIASRVIATGWVLAWCVSATAIEVPAGWQRTEADWSVSGTARVRSVYTPPNRPVTLRQDAKAAARPESAGLVNVIDAPPIDGFVPWITVVTTDERMGGLDFIVNVHDEIVGTPTTPNPQTDYAIGIFDTGAVTHLMGYVNGQRLGLHDDGRYLTQNTTDLIGATGEPLPVPLSQPMGVFADGLDAIDPETLLLDTGGMIGESNISILLGPEPDPPLPEGHDLPTVVGVPFFLYHSAVIRNDRTVTIERDGTTYRSPLVEFYTDPSDPDVPELKNRIPLQLRPGGSEASYFPCFPDVFECLGEDDPASPTVVSIFTTPSPSYYFVSDAAGVDLFHNERSSTANDAFLVDTGAQVTVIGSGVGARLRLNPDSPDFLVEIQTATGAVSFEPGFHLDLLEIPSLGPDDFSFTNVPVVLLDVLSPEGGFLDGIIGMNLFVQYNMVLRGGGLLGVPGDPPALFFERIAPPPDIPSDFDKDGDVDADDLAVFLACAAGPAILYDVKQLPAECTLLPVDEGVLPADFDRDGDIDQQDFGRGMQRCFSGAGQFGDPTCAD